MSLTKRRIVKYILLNINKIYSFKHYILFAKHYILFAKQMTDKQ